MHVLVDALVADCALPVATAEQPVSASLLVHEADALHEVAYGQLAPTLQANEMDRLAAAANAATTPAAFCQVPLD